jgi:hypothetical protein
MNKIENVFIKLTSAISVAGVIRVADEVIEVVEHEAIRLLNLGKAVLATADDQLPQDADEAEAAPADEAKPAE